VILSHQNFNTLSERLAKIFWNLVDRKMKKPHNSYIEFFMRHNSIMFTANTNVASNMAANAAVMVISAVICGNAKGLSGLGGGWICSC
jgi:hypothetical protein